MKLAKNAGMIFALEQSSESAVNMNEKPAKKKIESALLAELAGEATSKLKAMQSETDEQEARSQQLSSALKKTYQFLQSLSVHVNNIAPNIPRTYRIDSDASYGNLAWQDALADYRKQSLSDTALIDHVAFSVRLQAPDPVTATRRWNQMDTFRKELDLFGLRPLDDPDMLVRNKSQQETFSLRIAPDFFLKLIFKGDYANGMLEINGRNFDEFGVSTFRLKPEQVSSELLDDLGRFLIGRTEELPEPLRLARSMSRQFL